MVALQFGEDPLNVPVVAVWARVGLGCAVAGYFLGELPVNDFVYFPEMVGAVAAVVGVAVLVGAFPEVIHADLLPRTRCR